MRMLLSFAVVLLLAGCGPRLVAPNPYPSAAHTCKPYEADELMVWAQDVPGYTYHNRQAYAAVEGGYVACGSYEEAGSGTPRPVQRYHYSRYRY